MNTTLKRTLVVGALLSTTALAPKAQAQTVVISQVYGGGGGSSTSASFKNDFIELYNNGLTTIDLTGFSLQYASATGIAVSGVSALTGTIASHDYFLVQTGTAGTGGSNLPNGPGGFAYNGTGSLNLSATSGVVFLANNTTTATFTVAAAGPPFVPSTFSTNVLDVVGYGTPKAYEGTAPAPIESVSLSDSRVLTAGIYPDTNNNGADFASGTPTPHVGAYAPAPEPSGTASILVGAAIMGGLLCVARRRTTGQSQAA